MTEKALQINSADKQIPTGWHISRLGDVCEIIAGQSPPGSTYRDKPEGLPFFQGKANFGLIHPVAHAWCVEPKKIALPGDILISVRAPVGPTNVADVECCIGRGLAAIRCSEEVERDFILYALRMFETELVAKGSGSTFEAIKRNDLEKLEIPIPPFAEQKRIARILNEQMAAVEQARKAAKERKEVVYALPTAILHEVFKSVQGITRHYKRLSDVAELMPSRSIASNGDVEVLAVTTACLTEWGFLPDGIKKSKMLSQHVQECLVKSGEILIARSNTAALVGRVSMYDGNPSGVVASDLTIRIWPNREKITAAFLSAYLCFLYKAGYWREKAGGTSGSMKKITRAQVLKVEIPIPDRDDQIAIVQKLDKEMPVVRKLLGTISDELDTIGDIPNAILRNAFFGAI